MYKKMSWVKTLAAILLGICLFSGGLLSGRAETNGLAADNAVDTLTYAVFPYLPDVGYYQELIEKRWAEIEPDIQLIRADWNCYKDAPPDGIDVIMYDSAVLETLIDAGWIQPIAYTSVLEADDIFAYALEGITLDNELYGIPVFLCGNYLVYDLGSDVLAEAEHITDLSGESEILVISSDDASDRRQFTIEILADTLGEANPLPEDHPGIADDLLALIDQLAIDAHTLDHSADVAKAYDLGEGIGYISYSETMRFLENRISRTGIKAISFSDQDNLSRVFTDAVAITREVEGERLEKCVELINVIAESDVLLALSLPEGTPPYLLLARHSPYAALEEQYPLYASLEEIASNEENHVILR